MVAQPLFKLRQFVQVKGAKGARRGDKLFFDKAANVATQGGSLTETQTIPQTNFTIKQGTLTITEYGNSVPWTGKLESLSEFDVEDAVQSALLNDMAKVLDSQAGSQFTAGQFKAVNENTASLNVQTAGTASKTATANLSGANTREAADFLRKRNVPFFDGSNYICVGSVELLSGMHGDTATGGWIDVSKYTDAHADNIFRGEIGKYYQVRFVEETNFLSNAIGASTAYGEGVLFGADAVMEGVAVPEEIRANVPADFGRDQRLAWYFLGAWQKIWDESNDGDERILHFTSL
jgi:N4-gp56 family major capsid protein